MELGYCRAWAVAVVAAALPRLPARTKKKKVNDAKKG
jgi:hypothetical protein